MKQRFQLFLIILFITISFTYHACTPKVSDKVTEATTEMTEVSKEEILTENTTIKPEIEVDEVPPVKDLIPVDPDVRIGTLDNGLKILHPQ